MSFSQVMCPMSSKFENLVLCRIIVYTSQVGSDHVIFTGFTVFIFTISIKDSSICSVHHVRMALYILFSTVSY
jgi:hypothetical protein